MGLEMVAKPARKEGRKKRKERRGKKTKPSFSSWRPWRLGGSKNSDTARDGDMLVLAV
ncbi:MAG: hypothetical protein ACR2M3_20175 [Thermomicrobiales bacterium]